MDIKLPLVSFLAFLLLFSSCDEGFSEVEVEDSQAHLMNLSDSCSYQLDGKLVIHDKKVGFIGRGNAQVNLDSTTDKGHPDSVLFWTGFKVESETNESLTLRFVKKYGKNQLTKSEIFIARPEEELKLYTQGRHSFAVDFERFNTQNGVTIDIVNKSDKFRYLKSYLPESRRWLTTIGYDCQNNSNFEITNLHKLPNGKYLLEAKFDANVFYYEEKIAPDNNVIVEGKQKRIEKGYIRLHL